MTPQQSRELVFHDGGASWVVDLPAEPRIPEAREVSSLGRTLGIFPKAPDQSGAWLLCDCQDDALQGYRVTQGSEIGCPQCKHRDQLLFCDCGVLSHESRRGEDEEAFCLLCGAAASKLRHRCKLIPGRTRIALAEGTASCCFCGWPGELWSESHQKPNSRRLPQAGESSEQHESTPAGNGLQPIPAEAGSEGRDPVRVIDTFAARWRMVGSWIRSSKRVRYCLVVLGAVVPVVGMWLLLAGYTGPGGPAPGSAEPLPEAVVSVGPPSSTPEASQLDLSEVQPPPISVDDTGAQEAMRVRKASRRLRQALDGCDFPQLEAELGMEPSVLSRLEADPKHARTLREAQGVVTRFEALEPLRPDRIKTVVDSWAALRSQCSEPGLLAPLETGIRDFLDSRVLELEENRAWREIEDISGSLARHEPSRELAESYAQRALVGRHRAVLQQARQYEPHRGIAMLQQYTPPADLTTEHEGTLQELGAKLRSQDANPPQILLRSKAPCQAKSQIELTLNIEDDYKVETVQVDCEGGSDPKGCRDIRPIGLSNRSEHLWGITIDPEIHGGKKLEIRVVATDLSGQEGVLNAVVRFFPVCWIKIRD